MHQKLLLVKASRALLVRNVGAPATRLLSSSSSSDKNNLPVKRQVKNEKWLPYILSLFGIGKIESVDGKRDIDVKDLRWPHAVEAATGDYKMYLLAFEQGFIDPYCTLPVERQGRGSKDNPIPIPTFDVSRTVSCLCEEHSSYCRYTTVYKGEMKRCECGHWLKAVDPPNFLAAIPEEELMTIPKYRRYKELKAEGKEAML